MIAAKAATGHSDLRSPVLPLQIWNELVEHVALILHVPPDSRPRMHAFVVPTLAIDRVHTKNLNFAGFDLSGERPNHPRVFVLIKAPHRRGKHENRLARVSVNQRLHVASQFVAVLFMKFPVHVPRIVTEPLQSSIPTKVASGS